MADKYYKYKKYQQKYYQARSRHNIGLTNKPCAGKDNNLEHQLIRKLSREYARYQAVTEIMVLDSNPAYQMALEIVLVNMANLQDPDRKDQIFVERSIEHTVFHNIKELAGSESITINEINILLAKINDIIKEFLNSTAFREPVKYGINNNIFYCDKFKKKLDTGRIAALKKMVEKNEPSYAQYSNILILICLIRYECLLGKFQQWSMPPEWYTQLYEDYKVRYEGFASPFDSHFIVNYNDTTYSSLFHDTDRYFGSIGNFFDYKPPSTKQVAVIVPPFINEIVKQTMNRVLELAKTSNNKFILVCPEESKTFEFSRPYRVIRQSEQLLFRRKIVKEKWSYVVHGVVSELGTDLNIFVLASDRNDNTKYFRMANQLKQNMYTNNAHTKHKLTLEKEYDRYQTIQKITALNTGYEWKNILERFLNSMANVNSDNDVDQVFADLDIDHQVYQKMISEMNEKKIANSKQIALDIQKMISLFLAKKSHPSIDNDKIGRRLTVDKKIFYCDDYEIEMNAIKMISFINKLGFAWDKGTNHIYQILIALLRYECVMARGQNWNIPLSWYSFLYRHYNLKLEGFSSPFNSQLLILSPDAHFCSLFQDTDGPFGSLGSLFDLDILDYYKKYIGSIDDNNKQLSATLHPPYIPHILEKMVDLIDKWFESGVPKLRLFVGFPFWKDYPLIDRLHNHKYLKYERLMKMDEFYFENSMDSKVTKLFPVLNRWTFIFANFDLLDGEPPYEKAIKTLKYQLVEDI